ncbi:MAG TPA: fibronectin type III domain-containing protein [Verrucomicrobiae bacterium]|nr:fibronectin type III domain-containing protein [Verrucomicrobiae bacterium]
MDFGKESRKSRASTSRGGRWATVLLALFFCLSNAHGSQIVQLAWNPSQTSTVAGYFLYCVNENGMYTNKIDIGINTTASVSGLQEGQTYHFAVTAYNSAGVESAPSSAVSYITPGLIRLLGEINANAMGMEFPVAPGHWYEVQASTDMQAWSTIGQTGVATSNVWTQFSDPSAGQFPTRFYRLVLH